MCIIMVRPQFLTIAYFHRLLLYVLHFQKHPVFGVFRQGQPEMIRLKSYHQENMSTNVYPLIPHFYIAKLGYAGVTPIFLIFTSKHRLWVLVRTASARQF